jgi:hypothetical protein
MTRVKGGRTRLGAMDPTHDRGDDEHEPNDKMRVIRYELQGTARICTFTPSTRTMMTESRPKAGGRGREESGSNQVRQSGVGKVC